MKTLPRHINFSSQVNNDAFRILMIMRHISWKPADTANPREAGVNTPVGRQYLSKSHVKTATDTHTTIEELLEAVFFCAVRAEVQVSNTSTQALWRRGRIPPP
jgi:hypothetical protein